MEYHANKCLLRIKLRSQIIGSYSFDSLSYHIGYEIIVTLSTILSLTLPYK